MIDALMVYAICKQHFLGVIALDIQDKVRPYLELALGLAVKIVCVDSVDRFNRCWRKEIISILSG